MKYAIVINQEIVSISSKKKKDNDRQFKRYKAIGVKVSKHVVVNKQVGDIIR